MAGTGSPWRDPTAWALVLWGLAVARLGFPPVGAWGLVLVAPVPLWVACLGASARDGFRRGWSWGAGFFGGLLWWLVPTLIRFGPLPISSAVGVVGLLCAGLALYPGLVGGAVAIASSRRGPTAALVLAPLAWSAVEAFRGVFLTGFPWGDLPQALWQVDAALAAAPWVGMAGVRVLIVGLAVGPAWGLARWGGHRPGPGALAWPVVAASVWGGLLLVPPPLLPVAGTFRVGVVQGNIDQAQKWDPSFRRATLDTYRELSRSLGPEVDLYLWPETAVPLPVQEPGPERDRLQTLARELNAPLVFGGPAYVRRGGEVEGRNAVFLMDPQGHLIGRYDKVHLVPFGEYVPFGRFLPFATRLVAGAGEFTPGPALVTLSPEAGLPVLGPLVCFEVIFPGLAAAHARAGAQVLAVVTNDAWFGDTPGPHQHLAFAAWRAAETGLPLVRAANSGVSGVFDRRGGLVASARLGTRAAFSAQVEHSPSHVTPCVRLRPWLAGGPAVLATGMLFAILRSPRTSRISTRGCDHHVYS